MKLFVVLALLAFTGCQANVLRSDEPKSQLELVNDAFRDYVAKARQTAQDTLQSIRESAFGQQVNDKITESVEVARQYAAVVQDQVTVIGQESYKKVSEQVERLSGRLQQDISEVRAQLEPYAEELKEKVEQRLQELAPLAESLHTEVAQRAKAVQQTVAPYVEALREKLDPYTGDIKSQLTDLWESLTKSD
ncbi:apolipoprotein A-I-like [Anguilla anguilla]|uniref:apolipoprotein A-I-like n=1 Tax=Anguilla anguilla TaxID=7936 RepID=UPI0015B336FA|nr:apolipoprotein A-I-like [Anguilla anguilla]